MTCVKRFYLHTVKAPYRLHHHGTRLLSANQYNRNKKHYRTRITLETSSSEAAQDGRARWLQGNVTVQTGGADTFSY